MSWRAGIFFCMIFSFNMKKYWNFVINFIGETTQTLRIFSLSCLKKITSFSSPPYCPGISCLKQADGHKIFNFLWLTCARRTGSDFEDKVASSISPQTPSSQNNFCIFQSSVSYLNISYNSKVEYILSRRLSGLVKFRYDPAFSFKGGSFWFDGATLLCGFLFGFFLQILTFCHLYSFYLQRSEL